MPLGASGSLAGPILFCSGLLFPEMVLFYPSYPMGSLNATHRSEAAADSNLQEETFLSFYIIFFSLAWL